MTTKICVVDHNAPDAIIGLSVVFIPYSNQIKEVRAKSMF